MLPNILKNFHKLSTIRPFTTIEDFLFYLSSISINSSLIASLRVSDSLWLTVRVFHIVFQGSYCSIQTLHSIKQLFHSLLTVTTIQISTIINNTTRLWPITTSFPLKPTRGITEVDTPTSIFLYSINNIIR